MPLFMTAMMSKDLYTLTGVGMVKKDGYFDINTVYLNVSGFALSGTFWDDISVVFAHPNNGIATPFKDIERALNARLTTTFTINKTQGARNESFSAELKG